MGDGDTLAVRFHYGGEFFFDGKRMHYVGGFEGLSYIERDLISLPEIIGHLKDHGVVVDDVLLHWLRPGKDLDDGLRLLHDDSVCLAMSNCIKGCGVAEVYVESVAMQLEALAEDDTRGSEANEFAEQMGGKTLIHIDGDSSDEVQYIGENKITAFQLAPIKTEEWQQLQIASKVGEAQESQQIPSKEGEIESSSDSEYLPGGFCSSEEDEEAADINQKFKEFKKKSKCGELKSLDDVMYAYAPQNQADVDVEF